ncbi:matrixin family metalloprotease [Patescibacteria group bacterium]|nr:matrixin family metalloprotease [Patescibacteria group bacterium]
MKKLILSSIVLFAVLSLSGQVGASMLIPASEQGKNHWQAPGNSPVIGENGDLERVDFIHYAKPENPGKPIKPPKTESCYKLMGVKWKDFPINYVINPLNPEGLSENFVVSTIFSSTETWDDAVSMELVKDNYQIDYSSAYGAQDYKNAIVFGDYPNDNVIAVTSVWYSPRGKKIVEFDMLFNTRFDWGDASINSALMDLQNIAVHEFGHGVGLSDLYNSTCAEVTMYGYSTEGEIKKRTLEIPDINGLQALYGI